MMDRRTVIVFVLVLFPVFLFAKNSGELEMAKVRVERLQGEITDLRLLVSTLDSLQQKLSSELKADETKFVEDFKNILVPLLNWPSIAGFTKVSSWVEHEHGLLILEKVRAKLVREPLELISDRELRIQSAERMKEEFLNTLRQLEKKEVLLHLQVEELRYLEKKQKQTRTKKGSGKTKS